MVHVLGMPLAFPRFSPVLQDLLFVLTLSGLKRRRQVSFFPG